MPTRRPAEFTGRIVVRLIPEVAAKIAHRSQNPANPDLTSLEDVGEALALDDLQAFFHGHPGFTSFPMTRGTRTALVAKREARAKLSPFPPRHSLLAYFVVDPHRRLQTARMNQALADLMAIHVVELAYREAGLHDPNGWAVDPGDAMVPQQGYLATAPDGIGVNDPAVWGQYSGRGIGFIDLERGWIFTHQELAAAVPGNQPLFNENDPDDPDHGTAVLGVVIGQPDSVGITGIAPRASFLGAVSRTAKVNVDEWDIVAAIQKAMDYLKDGDVLLIEVQTATGYPIETDDAWLDAIQVATGNEIIVIEAAGNGNGTTGRDLNRLLRKTSARTAAENRAEGRPAREADRTLDPNGGALFVDSGAILVSSCRSTTTSANAHWRTGSGGYGARVNCYAWGDSVVTSGYGDMVGSPQAKNKRYTETFNGTSAAAAIIAGAALLVQHMAVVLKGRRLGPSDMRTVLSGAPGTDVLDTKTSQKIGVMPDLVAIAARLSGA